MKKNGFSLPLKFHQILSWIVFLFISITFFIFSLIFIVSNYRLIILILYSLTLLFVISSCFYATKFDPSDPIFKAEISKREQSKKVCRPYVLEIINNMEFCVVCCSNVKPTSKHCKECDRCVENFDHHCVWLNNCIGDQNYKIFIFLLITVITFCSISMSIQIIAFVNFLNVSDDEYAFTKINNNAKSIGVSISISGYVTLTSIVVTFIIFFQTTYLIVYHCWLRCNNLTTYEFIMKYSVKNNLKELGDTKLEINKSHSVVKESFRKNENILVGPDLMNKLDKAKHKTNIFTNQKSRKIYIENVDIKTDISTQIKHDIYPNNKKPKNNNYLDVQKK